MRGYDAEVYDAHDVILAFRHGAPQNTDGTQGHERAGGLVTPARKQYLEMKAQHPDALLWFRMGDFYEMFDEDARIAAAALHITLTARPFGKDGRVPMAGVPYHAANSYLARLLRQGHRVAICEQLSPPGKGLVERAVVRVVSPGTVSEPSLLPARENSYLAALCPGPAGYGLAYVDVTTGEFAATEHHPRRPRPRPRCRRK